MFICKEKKRSIQNKRKTAFGVGEGALNNESEKSVLCRAFEEKSTGGALFAWGKPFWDREDEKVPHLLGADGERRSGGEKG